MFKLQLNNRIPFNVYIVNLSSFFFQRLILQPCVIFVTYIYDDVSKSFVSENFPESIMNPLMFFITLCIGLTENVFLLIWTQAPSRGKDDNFH